MECYSWRDPSKKPILPHTFNDEETKAQKVLAQDPTTPKKQDGTCYGLNYVPRKRYVEFLTPGTYECDLVWKWGLCRYDQDERQSYCIRVALILTGVLIQRGEFGH